MDLKHIIAMQRQELAEEVLRSATDTTGAPVELVPVFDGNNAGTLLLDLCKEVPVGDHTERSNGRERMLMGDMCALAGMLSQGLPVVIVKHLGGQYAGRHFIAYKHPGESGHGSLILG